MPRTRFGPTASGNLHLGGLCNLLLSHIVARKDGSEFFLRVDRHPDQMKYEAQIIEDIRAFGFEPDKIILQREREGRYLEVLDQILKQHESSGRVYHCNCSAEDIAFRGMLDGRKMKYIHREEKYPSPCDIVRVRAFSDMDPGLELVRSAQVSATISAREHPPENLQEDSDKFWRPKDVGYLGHRDIELTFRWQKPVWISQLEIETLGYPLRGYRVALGNERIEIKKFTPYYYCAQPDRRIREVISFAPHHTKALTLSLEQFMHQVKKEYYYDGYCRGKEVTTKRLLDRRTTIRAAHDDTWIRPDVAIWFEGQMDLCCTSIVDDLDFEIEVRVRGIDIEPFTWLEDEAAKLLGVSIPNFFHPMLVDEHQVKFSKFIGSPRAVELLSVYSKEHVLTHLARKLGLLPFAKGDLSLEDLVQVASLDYMEDVRTPIVCREEELSCK